MWLGGEALRPPGRRGREGSGGRAWVSPRLLGGRGARRAPRWGFLPPREGRCSGSAVRRVTTFRAGTPASEQERVLGYTGSARGHLGSLETGRLVNRLRWRPQGPARKRGGAGHPCPPGAVLHIAPRPPAALRQQFLVGQAGASRLPRAFSPTLRTRTLTSGRVPTDLTWLAGDQVGI